MEIWTIIWIIFSIVWAVCSGGAVYYGYKTYQKMLHPDGMESYHDYLKDTKNWKSEHLEDKVIWRYILNTDYHFEVRFNHKWESLESWIPDFPDSTKGKEDVILFIRWRSVSDPVLFISLDWGRFFIPVPEIWPNSEYLWKKDSLAFKLNKIVGEYPGWVYPHDIESFSERYNIPII